MKRNYFRSTPTREWIFSTTIRKSDGSTATLDLLDIGAVKIKRHVKIKADATPYDPKFIEYFRERKEKKRERPDETSAVAGLC